MILKFVVLTFTFGRVFFVAFSLERHAIARDRKQRSTETLASLMSILCTQLQTWFRGGGFNTESQHCQHNYKWDTQNIVRISFSSMAISSTGYYKNFCVDGVRWYSSVNLSDAGCILSKRVFRFVSFHFIAKSRSISRERPSIVRTFRFPPWRFAIIAPLNNNCRSIYTDCYYERVHIERRWSATLTLATLGCPLAGKTCK